METRTEEKAEQTHPGYNIAVYTRKRIKYKRAAIIQESIVLIVSRSSCHCDDGVLWSGQFIVACQNRRLQDCCVCLSM